MLLCRPTRLLSSARLIAVPAAGNLLQDGKGPPDRLHAAATRLVIKVVDVRGSVARRHDLARWRRRSWRVSASRVLRRCTMSHHAVSKLVANPVRECIIDGPARFVQPRKCPHTHATVGQPDVDQNTTALFRLANCTSPYRHAFDLGYPRNRVAAPTPRSCAMASGTTPNGP